MQDGARVAALRPPRWPVWVIERSHRRITTQQLEYSFMVDASAMVTVAQPRSRLLSQLRVATLSVMKSLSYVSLTSRIAANYTSVGQPAIRLLPEHPIWRFTIRMPRVPVARRSGRAAC